MNYLSPSIRVVGLVLMSVALGAVFLASCWVYSNRNHTVVIAAQPVLLYALCLGSAMMALTILLSSFDESYGWDQEMLGKACVGGVWLDSLGHMVAFGALFTKVRNLFSFKKLASFLVSHLIVKLRPSSCGE